MNEIEKLIEEIKQITTQLDLDPEDVFFEGECGTLYAIMRQIFNVVPYTVLVNGKTTHILSMYNEELYDIYGKFDLNKYMKLENRNTKESITEEMCEVRVSNDFEPSRLSGRYRDGKRGKINAERLSEIVINGLKQVGYSIREGELHKKREIDLEEYGFDL